MVHLALPLCIHCSIKYTVYVTGYASGSMNMQRAWNVRVASPTQRPLSTPFVVLPTISYF